MKGCKHRHIDEWLKYKRMSPWKDTDLWEDNRPQWKRRGLVVYKKLPRGIAVRIASLMQVYGRPLINKMKR